MSGREVVEPPKGVAYEDVPKVNALYAEQATLNQGIAIIDAGGKVSSFTLAPPVPEPGQPYGPMMMGSSINTIDPSPELIASARASMVTRNDAISAELTTLGVDAPVDPPVYDK